MGVSNMLLGVTYIMMPGPLFPTRAELAHPPEKQVVHTLLYPCFPRNSNETHSEYNNIKPPQGHFYTFVPFWTPVM